MRLAGTIDPIGHRILEERLTSLTQVETGCERIARTPLPFAYTLLLHRTAYLFCLVLPFGLITTAGWATPLFTAFIAYTFFDWTRLSEELEDPFGTEANDLALDSLCRTCEISVLEALGEAPPSPLPARGYYLSVADSEAAIVSASCPTLPFPSLVKPELDQCSKRRIL